ncbi:MAG: DUF2304 domain-containing protein [Bacilli bacterium]|nr:DUF2304 domain-containing protein [Bacilli bacterium]
MSIELQIFLIILLLFQIFLIIKTVKSKKMSMKYCSFWLVIIFILIFITIFPNLIFKLSDFLGFEKTSNMIFLIGFFFLFYIIYSLTISLSIQNNKIKRLIQEVSLLKESENTNGKKD